MSDSTAQAAKTPWHLWVIGVLALLWNAVGAMDFTLTQIKYEPYFKAYTSEQKEYFFGFPIWIVIPWGIATWGSVIASLLLLLRRKSAAPLYLVAFVCMVLTNIYTYGLSSGIKMMGAGAAMFSAVIFVISLLLFHYARSMRARGVLR